LGITFEIRKNSQFWQGNKVTVAATNDIICPLQLLLKLKSSDVNAIPNSPIFCGFNGRLVEKSPHKTSPSSLPIKNDQYVRYISFWYGEVFGISTQEFKALYGSQSGRVVVLQQLLMRVYLLNFGAIMGIGQLIKAKNVT
jgi:hypothetical protein